MNSAEQRMTFAPPPHTHNKDAVLITYIMSFVIHSARAVCRITRPESGAPLVFAHLALAFVTDPKMDTRPYHHERRDLVSSSAVPLSEEALTYRMLESDARTWFSLPELWKHSLSLAHRIQKKPNTMSGSIATLIRGRLG